MQTEPTYIIAFVRIAVLVAGFFGFVLTESEQAVIAGAIAAVVAAVEVLTTVWNRRAVYAPATVDRLLQAGNEPAPDA